MFRIEAPKCHPQVYPIATVVCGLGFFGSQVEKWNIKSELDQLFHDYCHGNGHEILFLENQPWVKTTTTPLRSILLIVLISACGGTWLLEQPATSLMPRHWRFRWLVKRWQQMRVRVPYWHVAPNFVVL